MIQIYKVYSRGFLWKEVFWNLLKKQIQALKNVYGRGHFTGVFNITKKKLFHRNFKKALPAYLYYNVFLSNNRQFKNWWHWGVFTFNGWKWGGRKWYFHFKSQFLLFKMFAISLLEVFTFRFDLHYKHFRFFYLIGKKFFCIFSTKPMRTSCEIHISQNWIPLQTPLKFPSNE